jgi:murein DD-endopeptidase MepM/ murein hydrolase activator NlpD
MNFAKLRGFYVSKLQKNKKILYMIAGCSILMVLFMFFSLYNRNIYAISVDGKVIGNAKNEKVIEKLKQELLDDYRDKMGCEIAFYQNIQVEPVKALGQKVDTEQQLREKFRKILSVKIKAVCINIDEKQAAIVSDKEIAERVLQDVKDHYVEKTPGDLIKIDIAEKVTLAEKYVNPLSILNEEDAKNLILQGSLEMTTYKVQQGDTLWDIAHKQDMSVEELIQANPQLKSVDKLALGEIVNLKTIKPLLNVVVTKKVVYSENIPYKTETVKDKSIVKGNQKIKQTGQNGERQVTAEVTYKNGAKIEQNRIDEKIVKEPVNKIVACGTKVQLASRGSGRFLWPSSGRVTSPFGRRGRGMHTGIDIANSKGTAIYAANSGTVSFVGRKGGYGNLVIINHGGGFSTYYAHCNSTLVKSGQSVSRGQKIATVGTTGRTTGPHLHFEVRVNGQPKNPISYLGK